MRFNNRERGEDTLIGIFAILWEWLAIVALTFWSGILVIESTVLNRKELSSDLLTRCWQRTLPLQWLCLSVLLVAEIVTFILETFQIPLSTNSNGVTSTSLGQIFFQSTYGFVWIARIILIAGSLGLLIWLTMRQKRSITFALLTLAGLILVTFALSDHAIPQTLQLHYLAVVLDYLSLAAQSIWFGGLAYLGYVLLPLLPEIEPDRRAITLTTLARRFKSTMIAAICVLFVSELLLTLLSLSNFQQFITEPFGRALLVKWALILVMAILSAYTFFVLFPAMNKRADSFPTIDGELAARQVRQFEHRAMRGTQQVLSIASWLGGLVLLCGVIMTFFSPALVSSNQHAPQNSPTGNSSNLLTMQTKQMGNLLVTLTVTPGKINVANTVTVKITDTQSGQYVSNARVEVSTNMEEMNMGTVRDTLTGGTPTYSATFPKFSTFTMTGIWDITLLIQLPQQAQNRLLFQVWLSSDTQQGDHPDGDYCTVYVCR